MGWLACTTACRKEVEAGSLPVANNAVEGWLDSLYLYAKQTYLWYAAIPDYAGFNPRKYAAGASDITALTNSLTAIAGFSFDNPGEQPREFRNGSEQPIYSYIAEGNIYTGRSAAVNTGDHATGFGMGLSVFNNAVYVSYAEPGSPAFKAGVRRGMQLIKVNDEIVHPDPAQLRGILRSPLLTFHFENVVEQPLIVTLQTATYVRGSVLYHDIIDAGTVKTGYIALSGFYRLENAKADFDQIAEEFAQMNVQHLIIDLRYNSGGYLRSMEYLANLIAPAALHGSVMYAEHFNRLLQERKAPILESIPFYDANGQPVYINGRRANFADVDFSVSANTVRFSKSGSLNNIRKIIFIVSSETASAAELLINIFRPYIDVKLVGSKTYGKPVGSFGIGLGRFMLYLSQFHILNANNDGYYFEGLEADIPAIDEVTKDFGDISEDALAQAMHYLTNGTEIPANRMNVRMATAVPINILKDDCCGMLKTEFRISY